MPEIPQKVLDWIDTLASDEAKREANQQLLVVGLGIEDLMLLQKCGGDAKILQFCQRYEDIYRSLAPTQRKDFHTRVSINISSGELIFPHIKLALKYLPDKDKNLMPESNIQLITKSIDGGRRPPVDHYTKELLQHKLYPDQSEIDRMIAQMPGSTPADQIKAFVGLTGISSPHRAKDQYGNSIRRLVSPEKLHRLGPEDFSLAHLCLVRDLQ